MNQKVTQELPTRGCDNCKQLIYDVSLRCNKCKTTWEPCIISGYPLTKQNTIQCKSCGKGGIRECWNLYMQHFANCPWCGNAPN